MNTGMRCHVVLQGIFSPQRLNSRLHWQSNYLPLVLSGKPYIVSEFPTIFSLKKETELLLKGKNEKKKKTLFIILTHVYLNKTLVYKASLMMCYDATKSSQTFSYVINVKLSNTYAKEHFQCPQN